jgi:hypothetical protein
MFHPCAGNRMNKGMRGEITPFKMLSTLCFVTGEGDFLFAVWKFN